MFRIDVASFHRLVTNARIFQPVKGRGAEFYPGSGVITMYSADATTLLKDYSGLYEEENPELGWNSTYSPSFILGGRELNDLHKWLSNEAYTDTDPIQVMSVNDGGAIHVFHSEDNFIELPAQDTISSREDYDVMLSKTRHKLPDEGPWAIYPDRVRKLSLVKPGDYPLALKMVYHSDYKRNILLWRAGPTVMGALDLLDLDVLKENPLSKQFLW